MKPSGVECFAGDLSSEEQGIVYATHFAPALAHFTQANLGDIAWRSRLSWAIVASKFRTVNPELERASTKRIGAEVVEMDTNRVPMLSRPKAVLDAIREAAKAAI